MAHEWVNGEVITAEKLNALEQKVITIPLYTNDDMSRFYNDTITYRELLQLCENSIVRFVVQITDYYDSHNFTNVKTYLPLLLVGGGEGETEGVEGGFAEIVIQNPRNLALLINMYSENLDDTIASESYDGGSDTIVT